MYYSTSIYTDTGRASEGQVVFNGKRLLHRLCYLGAYGLTVNQHGRMTMGFYIYIYIGDSR